MKNILMNEPLAEVSRLTGRNVHECDRILEEVISRMMVSDICHGRFVELVDASEKFLVVQGDLR